MKSSDVTLKCTNIPVGTPMQRRIWQRKRFIGLQTVIRIRILYDYDAEQNQIEIGKSIERPSWGKGLATEALIGVLKYLTEHEGIEVITAWCASDNIGSMKAMQKAGMRQTALEKGTLEVDGKKYDKLIYRYRKSS